MGPARRVPVKARALRAPINRSVSKGRTEVEPSCSASASSSRPDRRRNRAARLLQRRRLQQHRSRSWGWNQSTMSRRVKAWVASGQLVRTPGPDGRSVFTARTPAVPQVCDAVAVLASPPAKSLIIPTVSLPVQSAAQGEHPVEIVQHLGGWRLLSEGLGRCPRRASSGFHPKRQTPFRVKGEREDGVAFSAPEKPPDACTPASVTGLEESIPFCVIHSPGTCFCTGSAQGRRLMGFMRGTGRPICSKRDHIVGCVDNGCDGLA
jgi:hypothetical protein